MNPWMLLPIGGLWTAASILLGLIVGKLASSRDRRR